jgi:hypothetical protein
MGKFLDEEVLDANWSEAEITDFSVAGRIDRLHVLGFHWC